MQPVNPLYNPDFSRQVSLYLRSNIRDYISFYSTCKPLNHLTLHLSDIVAATHLPCAQLNKALSERSLTLKECESLGIATNTPWINREQQLAQTNLWNSTQSAEDSFLQAFHSSRMLFGIEPSHPLISIYFETVLSNLKYSCEVSTKMNFSLLSKREGLEKINYLLEKLNTTLISLDSKKSKCLNNYRSKVN